MKKLGIPQKRQEGFCAECGLSLGVMKVSQLKKTRFCTKICFSSYWKRVGMNIPEDVRRRGVLNLGTRMLGKKHSDATKSKMSKAAMGKPKPKRLHTISPIRKLIRSSIRYKQWRTFIFQRDDYVCQMCFVRGGKLNVDHVIPFSALLSTFRERNKDVDKIKLVELSQTTDWLWNEENGRTLCVPCHKTTPTYLSGALKYRSSFPQPLE